MATFSRRGFLKLTGAGVTAMTLSQLGFDLKPAQAYAASLKIEGCKEVGSICPFCAVTCHYIAHVRDGKVISTEGDADYPVSEGSLCAKGAAQLSMINSHHRLLKPMYRAPHSDKWEEKSWEWTLDKLARNIKKTRDNDFKRFNDQKQEVNRVESIFHLGCSIMDNEECSVVHQGIRGLGMVHFDHQARI